MKHLRKLICFLMKRTVVLKVLLNFLHHTNYYFYFDIGNAKALAIVEKTLKAMRSGGIFDHIEVGFHRYSTDSVWLLPHFEKNAL